MNLLIHPLENGMSELYILPADSTEAFALSRWHREWVAGTASLTIGLSASSLSDTVTHQSVRIVPDPQALERKR